MKQKILLKITACITAALIVSITLGVNFTPNSSDLSDITLANVEALANNEDGSCGCYGPKVNWEQWGYGIWCACDNNKCCKDLQGCD